MSPTLYKKHHHDILLPANVESTQLSASQCLVYGLVPSAYLNGTPDERAPAASLQESGEEVRGRGAEVNQFHHAARQVYHALVDVPATQRLIASVQSEEASGVRMLLCVFMC